MRVILQPTFVLHSRPYNETSSLLEVFSEQYGRISLLARGARSAKSRLRGLLRPFTPLLISWSGRTELMYLSAVENLGAPLNLLGTALLNGFYLNELLLRLLPRFDANPQLFASYQHTLHQLHSSETQERYLRFFEKDLLTELGYGLSLQQQALTEEAIVADKFYSFVPGKGLSNYSGLQQPNVFQGKNLLALNQNKLENKEELHSAKRLMRLALGTLLGDKPLKSRELFLR